MARSQRRNCRHGNHSDAVLPSSSVPETPESRQSTQAVVSTPPTQVSYAGPFGLPGNERFQRNQQLAAIQLQNELDASLLRIRAQSNSATPEQSSERSHSEDHEVIVISSDDSSSVESDEQEFPDGGLDIDVDVDDTDLPGSDVDIFPDDGHDLDIDIDVDVDVDVDDFDQSDSDIETSQALEICNNDRARLQDTINDLQERLHLLSEEHDQELQLAQINLDNANEQIQERDDQLVILQDRLDNPTSHADGDDDDNDAERLIDMSDMHIEEVASLTEQLAVSNDRIEDLEQQIEDLEVQITELQGRLDGTDAEDDSESTTHLTVEIDRLTEQVSTHEAEREDLNQEIARLNEQLDKLEAHNSQRDAALQFRGARLDALWDTLRNFRDKEATDQEKAELQARVEFLTAVNRRARDQINGEADVEHAEEGEQDTEEVDRLTGELEDMTARHRDAALEVDRLRRDLNEKTLAASPEGDGADSADDEDPLVVAEARIETLNERVATIRNQYFVAMDENAVHQRTIQGLQTHERRASQLNRELVDARQRIAMLEHRIVVARGQQSGSIEADADPDMENLRRHDAMLQETIDEMTADQELDREEYERELASLRSELKAAREENAQLQDGIDLRDLFHQPASYDEDEGTPLDPDPLPQAKRRRRSPSEIDTDYEFQEENEVDSLITPSSFIESEPSPLLPRHRRGGKTRRQSQRLSESQEPEDDDEEAQFLRDLAATAPADPRGEVLVIDRGKVPRVRRAAGKSRSSKRKRY